MICHIHFTKNTLLSPQTAVQKYFNKHATYMTTFEGPSLIDF